MLTTDSTVLIRNQIMLIREGVLKKESCPDNFTRNDLSAYDSSADNFKLEQIYRGWIDRYLLKFSQIKIKQSERVYIVAIEASKCKNLEWLSWGVKKLKEADKSNLQVSFYC